MNPLDAATPAEWWWLAKACAWLAIFCLAGMLFEGPISRWNKRDKHFKDQEWRKVPPPNWRSSRGGREYW